MNRLILALSLAATSAVGFAPCAQADVVTFNDIPALGATPPSVFPLTSGGLVFTSTSLFTYIVPSDAALTASPSVDKPGNGSNYLAFAATSGGQYLSITQSGGGDFSLYSIDMMQSLYTGASSPTDHVKIEYFDGSGMHSETEAVGNSFSTLTLDLSDVTKVEIFRLEGQPYRYWGLDNVNSSATGPVPEPAAWAMILTGFFGIGAITRRRRQAGPMAAA